MANHDKIIITTNINNSDSNYDYILCAHHRHQHDSNVIIMDINVFCTYM